MKKITAAVWAIILLSFVISFYLYPQMPEKMASHWNAGGQVNGYMSKSLGLFFLPVLLLAMFLLFNFLPKIDPLKNNIEKFRNYYDMFIFSLVLFLFYIHILSVSWNLNFKFNMIQLMMPALGGLFFLTGFMIEKSKRNWFIGIRTPWTLSSDIVWEKTHKLGGKLLKIVGLLAFAGIVFQKYAFILLMVPLFAAIIYLFIFSYTEYQKEKTH